MSSGDISHNSFCSHRTKGNNLGDSITAVIICDITDNLISVFHTKVDIKVWHRNPFRVQKALEKKIIAVRVPEASEKLREQLVSFVQGLRELDLKKKPAVSETIDWARTLVLLHAEDLGVDMVRETLNVLLKFQDDIENVDGELNALTSKAQAAAE